MSSCCTCFSNTTPFQLSSCHHVVLASATQPPSNCHHVIMLHLFQQHNPLPAVIMSSCCTCFSNTTPFQLSSCHHVVLVSAKQPSSNSHCVTMLFLQLPQQYNPLPTVITSSRCLCLSSTTPFQLSSHRLCHIYTTPVICHLVITPSLSQLYNPFHLSSCHRTVFVTTTQPLPFVISSQCGPNNTVGFLLTSCENPTNFMQCLTCSIFCWALPAASPTPDCRYLEQWWAGIRRKKRLT